MMKDYSVQYMHCFLLLLALAQAPPPLLLYLIQGNPKPAKKWKNAKWGNFGGGANSNASK